jgi:biotin-dependent carboxylase-like uncharacterized protein
VLRLGRPDRGLRSYLAARGGFDVPAVLGSRSTDTLSGLGPAPLRKGDWLGIGDVRGEPSAVPGSVSASAAGVLSVLWGPREDWFTADAQRVLVEHSWTVRSDSDRVGVRLDGPPLHRSRAGELPSEPTRPGAIQVPADGRPIIFGPDGPVTGGYPVIAVVDDIGPAAQLRPGDSFRFTAAPHVTQPTPPRRPAPRPGA